LATQETWERKPTAVSAGTVSNAAEVVSRLRTPFRECYNRQLALDRAAAGRIRLAIHVGASGAVSRVEVTPSGNLGSVVQCVQTVASGAQFAPPEGGSAVIVVPITFERTDDAPCVRPK
jgi:TonB family protein